MNIKGFIEKEGDVVEDLVSELTERMSQSEPIKKPPKRDNKKKLRERTNPAKPRPTQRPISQPTPVRQEIQIIPSVTINTGAVRHPLGLGLAQVEVTNFVLALIPNQGETSTNSIHACQGKVCLSASGPNRLGGFRSAAHRHITATPQEEGSSVFCRLSTH